MSGRRTFAQVAADAAAGAIAREAGRTRDFIAERIAAVKAQVQSGKVPEAAGSLTILHLESLSEMLGQRLHDDGGAA